MTMQLIIWSLLALYGALAVGVLWWVRRQRRIGLRLLWPQSTTQRQMENWGVRSLERQGWEISSMANQAALTVWHGIKFATQPEPRKDELFVVFLRDGAFFRRLLTLVGKFGFQVLGRMVIVLYDRPSETMIMLAAQQKIALAHFTELSGFGTTEDARRLSMKVVLEAERRVRALPTS